MCAMAGCWNWETFLNCYTGSSEALRPRLLPPRHVCVCVWVCMYALCMHVYMHTCMCRTFVCICTHTRAHTCVWVHTCACMCPTCVCAHAYMLSCVWERERHGLYPCICCWWILCFLPIVTSVVNVSAQISLLWLYIGYWNCYIIIFTDCSTIYANNSSAFVNFSSCFKMTKSKILHWYKSFWTALCV